MSCPGGVLSQTESLKSRPVERWHRPCRMVGRGRL